MKTSLLIATVGMLLLGIASTALSREPFRKEYSLQGITFRVVSPNVDTGNTVRVNPEGLSRDDRAVETRIRGWVQGARVADLNQDGFPEIYVMCRNINNEKGTIVAFACNKRRSMSQISVPDISDLDGYAGREEIAIEGLYLTRSFPVKHPNGDWGETRKLYYALKPGANSWMLVRDDGKGNPNANNHNNRPNRNTIEIRPRTNGQLEVLVPGGGVLLYGRSGNLIQKGKSVSNDELHEANKAVRQYRREQGL